MARAHFIVAYEITSERIFQRPVHPDAQASYEALVDHDNENIVYPVHDVARDITNDDVIDE